MSRVILLDAGMLGQLAHPRPTADLVRWTLACLRDGAVVTFSEVTDYELRRSFLLANLALSLARLDACQHDYEYLPLSTEVMLRAAQVWADARRMGRPLADPQRLDADAILIAQALLLADDGHVVVIATENVKHLSLFTTAQRWYEISPVRGPHESA